METSCFWIFFILGMLLGVDGSERCTVWSASECSVTCGGGTQTLTRTCTKLQACNSQSCTINGGYTTWSVWTGCSVTCGGGVKSRKRSCTNPPPSNGGKDCTELGPAKMTTECNECPCEKSLDVAILADISRSMKKDHLAKLKKFINDLVDNLGLSSGKRHCALITFGETATLHNSFDDASSHNAKSFKALVNQYIPDEVPSSARWGTRIDLAYNLTLTKLFNEVGRPNAEKVMIAFTDGEQLIGKWDNRPEIPFSYTTSALEAKGVIISVAGIGKKPLQYKEKMKEMVGTKGKLFLIADFADLKEYFEELIKAACGVRE